MRALRRRASFALVLCASVGVSQGACGDDDVDGAPQDGGSEASATPPEGGGPPDSASDGASIDPSSLRWERLPDLPTDGVRVGSESSVAVDADDRVLVAFAENAPLYMSPVSLSVFRHEASGWTVLGGAPLVPPGTTPTYRALLAVAADGTIFVAYTSGGAVVQRFSGGAWTALPSPGLTAARALTVDASGSPVLVGTIGASANVLTRFDGASWSSPSSPLDDAGAGPERGVLDVAPRPDGTIAAIVEDNGRGRAFVLSGASTWTPLGPAFGDALASRFLFPSLASAVDGRLAASWNNDYPDGGARRIFAARFDDAAQSFTTLGGALGTANASYIVTAIDKLHRPYVAWRDSAIHVSVFTGAWQSLPDVGERGTLPSIALDRRDLPVVSWEAPREAGTGSYIGVARAVPK